MSIFQKIIDGEIPSYKIAENENYLAFLDVFPLRRGHVLVIPKKATNYMFDMEDNDLSGLILFAKQVAKAIDNSIECKRVGVAVIGLEVPHAHVHLVPINSVADIDFSQAKMTFSSEEFEETAAQIRKAL